MRGRADSVEDESANMWDQYEIHALYIDFLEKFLLHTIGRDSSRYCSHEDELDWWRVLPKQQQNYDSKLNLAGSCRYIGHE